MRIVSVQGSGPSVLCLHGSPTSPHAFDGIVARLAPRRRVFVAALPGYAGTPALSPYDFSSLHTGIEATLLSEVPGPCDLVAFSLGTYHSFAVCLRGRVPVRSIVSLSGLTGIGDELRAAQRGMAAVVRAGQVPLQAFAERMLSANYLATHPEALATMQSWIDATTLDVIADEIEALAGASNLLSELGKLDIPILARAGELDVATPIAFSEAIVRAARSATLEIVPGAGHALLIEDAAATASSVELFLDALR